ncbi:hypothetical protein RR48_14119 [Papilio machaon]|uniref:Uncharacterized protein n=1 Tax=Papilio machaon TaxID=76193 RepID=A0A194QN27_PAPMA|nr:hypothetical protein RR48_14119 [Papilio machaon]
MPLRQVMKGMPSQNLSVKGILENDWEVLAPHQDESIKRLGMTIQLEQESYLTVHPEIKSMMSSFVAKMIHLGKRKEILKEAAEYFTRPAEVLDKEIRDSLGLSSNAPYLQKDKVVFQYEDIDLKNDLNKIYTKHNPPKFVETPEESIGHLNTESSSFISIVTSATTVPTPEPIPTPEPTLSETMFALVSNTVDKAVYQHVNDDILRYDTAYVELVKAVEEAMEIPVIEIREDIAELFYTAYSLFEFDIIAKEKLAAERAWEKRMRKKLKRTLRRMNNFKGYETPPTPKSEPSSHESYKLPPPRPCICHPQYNYNRYPKDRFGIYQPICPSKFSEGNATVTPAISVEDLTETQAEEKCDTKSIMSKKSTVSGKSAVGKKCAFN